MHGPMFSSLPQMNTLQLPNAPTMRWAVQFDRSLFVLSIKFDYSKLFKAEFQSKPILDNIEPLLQETFVLKSFCIFEAVSQLQQGVRRGARVEKRGKVELTANARAAPATSRRLKAGHKERERLWASAYKSKPRPEAHQACLICPQVSTNPGCERGNCNFSFQTFCQDWIIIFAHR